MQWKHKRSASIFFTQLTKRTPQISRQILQSKTPKILNDMVQMSQVTAKNGETGFLHPPDRCSNIILNSNWPTHWPILGPTVLAYPHWVCSPTYHVGEQILSRIGYEASLFWQFIVLFRTQLTYSNKMEMLPHTSKLVRIKTLIIMLRFFLSFFSNLFEGLNATKDL